MSKSLCSGTCNDIVVPNSQFAKLPGPGYLPNALNRFTSHGIILARIPEGWEIDRSRMFKLVQWICLSPQKFLSTINTVIEINAPLIFKNIANYGCVIVDYFAFSLKRSKAWSRNHGLKCLITSRLVGDKCRTVD